MSNGLEIKLLGPPEVFNNGGQPVKFAARKVLALFVYLVVETGSHPREKLQAIFWPESENHLAQSALRTTLARIKDALREVGDPLRMDGDRVGFNVSLAFTLDLELVARSIADTQPTQIAPHAIALLENAAGVSRGPFMDGFSLPDAPAFDEWLTIQRTNWGHRQNQIYDRLSLHQLEHHLIQPAIETVIRWIGLDHLNETAYPRLMRLHFLNGDRSAALQTYETCRNVLSHELGVEPSVETEEVLAYIRTSEAPARVAESDVEAREAFHIPFVGRSHEYQGLVQSFQLVKKGKPQVAVISGESGIGRTRLADEFLKWAGTEGADVLHGRAFETSAQLLAYQPIIDALRERLDRENAPEDLLDDAWLAELTRILPELRERYPDLPSPIGDDITARTRLFEAIARLAEALSARHPLIWLMDDLQWADTETLELLRYLSRNWRKGKSPILLLILMRSEALKHGTKQRDWMSGLTRDVNVTRFALTPVLASDIQEMIQALAGDHAEGISELSAWFTAETAGQPFFITEIFNSLNDYGALVWRDGKLDPLATLANLKVLDSESLAAVIRDVVLSRLEWLSQPAMSMLFAAAVIGRNCSFERLRQISELPEQDSLNSLDELLSAGMIIEIRDEARPYIISHDRVREVVYAQHSKARRQIFHRRAAFALTEQKAPPAELANHYAEAGDKEKAVEYLLKAGDDARGLYAYQESIAAYLRALALLGEMGDHEQTRVLEWKAKVQFTLALNLAKAHDGLGDFPAARAAIEQAQAHAKTDAERATALAYLGMLVTDWGDYSEGQKILAEVVPLARASGDSQALYHALYALGEANWWLGNFDDAKTALDESLALARALEDLTAELETLNRLGTVAITQGDLAKAERLLREVHTRALAAGDRGRVATALNNLGWTATERKDFAVAKEYRQQMLALAREIGAPMGIALGLGNLACSDILLGQLAAARAGLREALEISERIDFLPWALFAVFIFGDLAYAEGQTERALALYGLVRNQPAWTSDLQRQMDRSLAEWALDPFVVEAGMKKGAELDWDETVKELLK